VFCAFWFNENEVIRSPFSFAYPMNDSADKVDVQTARLKVLDTDPDLKFILEVCHFCG
jgi:hypothetical protein